MRDNGLDEPICSAMFILDGKEYTFASAFRRLLGQDKNVRQSRKDIYSYLMGNCRKLNNN